MSLDAINAEGIEEGLARWAANPGPDAQPGFSAIGFLSAGAKGVPTAVLEAAGSAVDAMSAAGNIMAATGGSGGGMFAIPSEKEQRQEAQARERMLKGENFSPEQGNVIRRKAAEFAPDPMVSHQADQVLHGLVRFGTKAVTNVGLFGGPVGAMLLGLEEGNTVSQQLMEKGVDPTTATKVGAVQGSLAAAGVVIPLAGKTIPQTIGLIGVGGPGSYMAQESLSREILQAAGYRDEASLHNPFDPLGLTLSAVIPGGFGSLHMRSIVRRGEAVKSGGVPLQQMTAEELRSLKYNDERLDAYASQVAEKYGVPPALLLAIKNVGEKSDPTAVSPKGAKGVMQFMPATAKEMGLADATDPLASIDAGARYLRKLFDAYGSWDAAVAHYNGGGAQAAIVRGGGRPTYNETAGYLDRVRNYMREHTAAEASKMPEAVDAARVAVLNDTVAKSLPDTPDAMANVQRAAEIVGETSGRVAEVEIPPVREHVFEPATVENSAGREVAGLRATFDNGRGGQGVMELAIEGDRMHPSWVDNAIYDRGAAEGGGSGMVVRLYEQAIEEAQNRGLRFTSDNSVTEAAARIYDALERRGYEIERNPAARLAEPPEVVTRRWLTDDGSPVFAVKGAPTRAEPLTLPVRPADNALPPSDSVSLAGDEPPKRGAEVGAARGAETGTSGAAGDGKSLSEKGNAGADRGAGEAASLDTLLAQKLATEQPDLQVILPGSDQPISIREALARISEEQKQDAQWADLVKVAAECALGS